MKAYIQVDAYKESPQESGDYITYNGWLFFDKDDQENKHTWYSGVHQKYIHVGYWLKEIDLSKLMIEFAKWKDRNYHHVENDWYTSLKNTSHFIEAKKFTSSDLVKEFLTEKGIITIE